jgi:hypothetical protein
MTADNLPATTEQNEPRAIARRNRHDEVTIHIQGSVTEWITSDVSFDRHDRGKLRDNRIETELSR